ncbi:hypothetical protein STA3757_45130 [Stanieria sp. NIES-3757]|nr:hypothetical protein STA3757_45130 [Stanieria sp. NIES-3757]
MFLIGLSLISLIAVAIFAEKEFQPESEAKFIPIPVRANETEMNKRKY